MSSHHSNPVRDLEVLKTGIRGMGLIGPNYWAVVKSALTEYSCSPIFIANITITAIDDCRPSTTITRIACSETAEMTVALPRPPSPAPSPHVSRLLPSSNLIERTDVSSFGFGSRPDNSTIISNDQISKLFQISQKIESRISDREGLHGESCPSFFARRRHPDIDSQQQDVDPESCSGRSADISGSCPRNRRMLPVFSQITASGMLSDNRKPPVTLKTKLKD
ncbi:hypothetical protein AKJ16_DCAP15875 [Drosera capensis]